MLNLALADEPPSAMVQQAFSIPYDVYQVTLWQNLMIGTVCGAVIALAVVFALLASGRRGTANPRTSGPALEQSGGLSMLSLALAAVFALLASHRHSEPNIN